MSKLKHERPLSPHLDVYRWQITMMMSIVHRGTGVALAVGAFGVSIWLGALATSPECYGGFLELAGSLIGQLAIAGFAFCLIYHLLNGLRHLLWDMGYGYEIPTLYATGWTVVVLAAVITATLWYCAFAPGVLA